MSLSGRTGVVSSCVTVGHGKRYDQHTAPTVDEMPLVDAEPLDVHWPAFEAWEVGADSQCPIDTDSFESDELALVARLAALRAGAPNTKKFYRIASVRRGRSDVTAVEASRGLGADHSLPVALPHHFIDDDLPPRRRKFNDSACLPEPLGA